MICIRCQRDSKYPERKDNGGKCPGCNQPFAFEPRTGAKMTDKAFQRAIDLVSSEGQVRWGVEHLYYELSRRNRSSGARVAAGCLLPLLVIATAIVDLRGLLLIVPLALFVGYQVFSAPSISLLSLGEFAKMWDRWGQIHGRPKSVIVRKRQEAKPARASEPDIADYSFDRAVICDRPRTVDLLLANNFHFENNCAVLSIGGYPQQAFETVRRMLRRNPRLEVFVLHDVTPEGCQLAHRLANDPEWFAGTSVRIVDVGLRPAHAGPFEGLMQDAQRQVAPGRGLSPAEARWLSKHTLELAVIRPEQIIKRLFRSMNKAQAAATTGRLPEGRDTPHAALPAAGASAGIAAVAGAAMLAPGEATAEEEAELLRQKKKAATDSSSGGDGGSGVEVDFDSFSSDADASDGGADSFG